MKINFVPPPMPHNSLPESSRSQDYTSSRPRSARNFRIWVISRFSRSYVLVSCCTSFLNYCFIMIHTLWLASLACRIALLLLLYNPMVFPLAYSGFLDENTQTRPSKSSNQDNRCSCGITCILNWVNLTCATLLLQDAISDVGAWAVSHLPQPFTTSPLRPSLPFLGRSSISVTVRSHSNKTIFYFFIMWFSRVMVITVKLTIASWWVLILILVGRSVPQGPVWCTVRLVPFITTEQVAWGLKDYRRNWWGKGIHLLRGTRNASYLSKWLHCFKGLRKCNMISMKSIISWQCFYEFESPHYLTGLQNTEFPRLPTLWMLLVGYVEN